MFTFLAWRQDLGADEVELDQGLQSAGLTSRAAVQMRSELVGMPRDQRSPKAFGQGKDW